SNRAFQWLERAIDAGFEVRGGLESDDDLNSLRDDPRFRQLRAKARASQADDRGRREAKSAVNRFERLQARPPASADPWASVGKQLLHTGEYDLAARAFQEAASRSSRPA